jgi:hypothetical protein
MIGEGLQSISTGEVSLSAFVGATPSKTRSVIKKRPAENKVAQSKGFESKYLLLRTTNKPKLVSWLHSLCRPDGQFPEAIIHSIYFDTRDWQLLRDKLESNFIKLKVRLRWYSDAVSGDIEGPSFLEVKRRVGPQREKRRVSFPFSGQELNRRGCDREVERIAHALLPTMGISLPSGLYPVFKVQYHRYRFVDSLTSSRLSVDSEIVALNSYSSKVPGLFSPPLNRVVLELKGQSPQLPAHLNRLADIGLRKSSFSKYAQCASQLLKLKI